jgi:hypothetical protein
MTKEREPICANCKSYSGVDKAKGWCLRKRTTTKVNSLCPHHRETKPVKYAMEAKPIHLNNN